MSDCPTCFFGGHIGIPKEPICIERTGAVYSLFDLGVWPSPLAFDNKTFFRCSQTSVQPFHQVGAPHKSQTILLSNPQETVYGKRDGSISGLAIISNSPRNIMRATKGWKTGVIHSVPMLPRNAMVKPESATRNYWLYFVFNILQCWLLVNDKSNRNTPYKWWTRNVFSMRSMNISDEIVHIMKRLLCIRQGSPSIDPTSCKAF